MSCTFTPSVCHINLGALTRNFKRLGQADSLMPVIKANAYGHGLFNVAAALDAAGARFFAVGTVPEGAALRAAGHKQQIIPLMGCLDMAEWRLAIANGLMPVAGSFEDLDRAEAILTENPSQTLQIAIKCDTGMSRLGFSLEDMRDLKERIHSNPKLKPGMLISHLACADMPEEDAFTKAQIQVYEKSYAIIRASFPDIKRSLGNSAATLGIMPSEREIVRPGLVLYGGNPFHGTKLACLGKGLEWVMSVSSPIIHIRELTAGQSVSYGRIFTAPHPMRIAIIGCGYANGLNRNLSNRFSVLVNGRRVPQIGRICMNMSMLDISELKDVKIGDNAWILGGEAINGDQATSAQDLADLLGTIPYEIMCQMGEMIPRVYE